MLNRSLCLALLLSVPLLAGCAARELYRSASGPFAVGHADGLVLRDEVQARDIPLRVVFPRAPGRYPVVVFSHGAFCYPQQYAAITDQWVAHGYVVVLPDHPDSPNNGTSLRPDQMGSLTATRIADLDAIFGNLDRIADLAGISGQLDTGRLGVAGHSYGTVIALAKAGLWMRAPDGGRRQYLDRRIRGAVIMSGVGQMDEMMAPDAFSGLTTPLIATGGTLDVGNTGGPVIHPWEWRMSPYTLAPPGDKYSVVLENADHYLGRLICRTDRGGDDDPEGAAIDAALTLAFLDAYVKQDPAALRFLATADIAARTGGRARFNRK
ncbi:MAG: alpha/beta fold hydrolase [Gammaproteobacteria bacterium]